MCVCVFWRLIPNKSVQIPILTFLVCEEVRSADDSGSFGEGGSGRLRTRGGVAVLRGFLPDYLTALRSVFGTDADVKARVEMNQNRGSDR